MKRLVLLAVAATLAASAQTLDPAALVGPPTDSWPTYNGDFSGRRFSPLKTINDKNVSGLSLSWVYRVNAQTTGPFPGSVKSSPVVVDGVMFFTVPDHVWAVDARTGRGSGTSNGLHGGIHIGNRGVGVHGKWLYFETPDCNLVSLDMADAGRWHKRICDPDLFYFASTAPLIAGNHVIAGVSGDDLDVPAASNRTIPRPARCSGAGTPTPTPTSPRRLLGPALRR
ncbi:MAG: PQQ-binding-like beta-propeller repeat protein [Bryobacterales bacterium]